MTTRADFARMAGEKFKFQAVKKGGKWGLLFDEFVAQGWRPVKVDMLTGGPAAHGRSGVWVMRFTGYADDEAVKFARRVGGVTVKSRKLFNGEK